MDLKPDGVVRRFGIFPAYSRMTKLLNAFGYRETASVDKRLVLHDYDWRLGIKDAALKLKDFLNTKEFNQADCINLIGHSMGALVIDALLKLPDVEHTNWYPFIRHVVLLGMPQQGVPAFLGYVSGQTCNPYGMKKSVVNKLANTPNIKTFYEVLPPSSYSYVTSDGQEKIDPFAPDIFTNLDLTKEGIEINRSYYSEFGTEHSIGSHIRIHRIIGTTKKTLTHFQIRRGRLVPLKTPKSGDDLVPTKSAKVYNGNYEELNATHRSLYYGRRTKSYLRNLFI